MGPGSVGLACLGLELKYSYSNLLKIYFNIAIRNAQKTIELFTLL